VEVDDVRGTLARHLRRARCSKFYDCTGCAEDEAPERLAAAVDQLTVHEPRHVHDRASVFVEGWRPIGKDMPARGPVKPIKAKIEMDTVLIGGT
jgi:hypothetical protein